MGCAAKLAECTVSASYSQAKHMLTIDRSNGARAGEVSERYGYRRTMIGALIAMTGFIFILFFAPNIQTLVIGEVFCGIPWGM